MSFSAKSTHIDRDDYDADHYADVIRDTHRSRLTVDQLDIANRQLRRKEKLLTHNHDLKMKEYTRMKKNFIRKLEEDQCLANLPSVRETLKAQRRKRLELTSSSIDSNEHAQDPAKSRPTENHSKTRTKRDSPRTERSKANLDKFNHTNTFLD